MPTVHKEHFGCAMAIAALLFLTVATVGSPAFAQSAPKPTGSVQLIDQSDWVSGGSPFDLAVKVNTNVSPDQMEIAVSVFTALPNRSQFEQTIEGRNLGSTIFLERTPLDQTMGPDGVVRMSFPVQDREQKRYYLRNTGVFPVKVELRSTGTGQSISSFTTHLINVNGDAASINKLGVAPMTNVAAPSDPSGNDPLSVTDRGASVNAVAASLTANADLPTSLSVSPESLDRLSTNADGNKALDALRNARAGRQVLMRTWASTGAPLFNGQLAGEGAKQLERGSATLDNRLGAADRSIALAPSPVDDPTLNALIQAGAKQVVVQDTSLADTSGTTPTRPFALAVGRTKQTVSAVQIDSGLQSHFDDPEGPVIGAHRLLADLAVLWNDRPAVTRGIVVTGPPQWAANPTFLNQFTRGLKDSPLLQPVSVDSVFGLPRDTTVPRRLNPTPKAQTDEYSADRILEQRRRVDGFGSLFVQKGATFDRVQQRLFLSEAANLTKIQRDQSLTKTSGAIDKEISAIRLPSERSIRLTAREGEIPISVQNDTGEPIQVIVRLSSDRIGFPGGATKTLSVERQQVTDRFGVEAKTSGVFPVQIRLESPDGTLVMARSRILVSSTVTTGVGVALSVGAGAFLALWWLRSAIKSRKRRASHT